MTATYRIALDTQADVAHAYLEGEQLTLCRRPVADHQLEESAFGIVRSTSMCGECRVGYVSG